MNETTVWYIKLVIAIILIIISIIISVVDVGVDVADTAVDAVTVGTVGAATNVADMATEIPLEIIQGTLLSLGMLLLTDEDWWLIILKIIIIVIAAGIDIVLTLAGFAPYVDFVETGTEVVTEIVQNAVFLSSIVMMFM